MRKINKSILGRLSLVVVSAILVGVVVAAFLAPNSRNDNNVNVELLDFSSMSILSRVDGKPAVRVSDDLISTSITTCTTGDEEIEAHSVVEFSSVNGGHHVTAFEITSTIEAGCTFSGEGCPAIADTCNPPAEIPIPNEVDRLAESGITKWVIKGRSDPTEFESQPESFESEEFVVIIDE